MNVSNKIMLITYPDSMGGTLKVLNEVLDKHFQKAVGGIHILPFFPSSGDRGFSPISYETVEPMFGNWKDIESLSANYYLMCDIMINHISKRSLEFSDYIENGDDSPYADMFLNYEKFWGKDRPNEKDIELLYRRKNGEPYQVCRLNDNTLVKLWCTFTDEQIDMDLRTDIGKEYITKNLFHLADKGINIIRLDALGYVVKRKNTKCFMVEPDIWTFIDEMNQLVKDRVWLLPEIHDTWKTAKKLEEHDIWSYDFVLPFLLLNTLYTKDPSTLAKWLSVAPKTQFTVLDTHDGIGVYDAFDWVKEEEADHLIELLEDRLSYNYKELNPEKKRFKKAYQLYATYFSALHEDEQAYLMARAIQFFAPGIPQVYYVGLLVGENDYEALERSEDHRYINRHDYTLEEIEAALERDVVKKLKILMEFRNTCEAFSGELKVEVSGNRQLTMIRTGKREVAELNCDFQRMDFYISYTHNGNTHTLDL